MHEAQAMHVQVSSWDEVVPGQRRQAVELVRSAFPDMQGDGYATPGPVALALALEGDQVVAHLALYERNVLLDGNAERIGHQPSALGGDRPIAARSTALRQSCRKPCPLGRNGKPPSACQRLKTPCQAAPPAQFDGAGSIHARKGVNLRRQSSR